MKQILLTKGKFTIVDDEDFEWLNHWRWKYHKDGYAVRTATGNKNIYMHRVINRTSKDFFTDHIDRNPLNNQKNNLRTVTNSHNLINTGLWKHNTSGFKGITWNKRDNKWQAQIMVNRKNIFLGLYLDINEACLVRKNAEKIYYAKI